MNAQANELSVRSMRAAAEAQEVDLQPAYRKSVLLGLRMRRGKRRAKVTAGGREFRLLLGAGCDPVAGSRLLARRSFTEERDTAGPQPAGFVRIGRSRSSADDRGRLAEDEGRVDDLVVTGSGRDLAMLVAEDAADPASLPVRAPSSASRPHGVRMFNGEPMYSAAWLDPLWGIQ